MMETIEKRSKNKTREQLAEMFIKSLDEQKLPWYAVWNTHPQQNAVSAKPYRGINAFLLSMVAAAFGYEDPRWCTFYQAKKKGWSIKKGAKGVPVEFWSAINIRTKEVMDFRESAQKIRDGEAEQGDFRYYNRNFHVFNAAQIEGMPELKKELPRQEISFCRISNHYYAKVQTEKGVEQCAMQFRPGRYFFETAAGKVHMLTPTEVERYMKFVAEEVTLEAVRQQTELLRQKTAGQIEQRNKTI